MLTSIPGSARLKPDAEFLIIATMAIADKVVVSVESAVDAAEGVTTAQRMKTRRLTDYPVTITWKQIYRY